MTQKFLTIVGTVALAGLLAFPTTSIAQQKTARQCNDEWTANKAAIQAKGQTKKNYVAECRGQAAGAPTATAPAAPKATTSAPAPSPTASPPSAAPKTAVRPPAPAASGLAAPGQFSSEAEAKAHCPTDTVVWANLNSRVYHFAGNRSYANTKKGAYMCERDTAAAGMRSAKNEKHP